MTRRMLFKRLVSLATVIALVPVAKIGPPPRPFKTVAATWDYPGYTEWSDGSSVVTPALNTTIDVLPVGRYYGLSINQIVAMTYQEYHAYRTAMLERRA